MNRRQFILNTSGTLLVTSTSVSAGCLSILGGGEGGKIKILDHKFYQKKYSAGVKGTLKNVSDKTLDSVTVTAKFLTKDGTHLGSSADITSNLSGETKWKFEIPAKPADVDKINTYEIEASIKSQDST